MQKSKIYEEMIEKYPDFLKRDINTVFQQACSKGDLEIVKYLCHSNELEHNASPFGHSGEAFQYACLYGHLNIVKFFMEYETEVENKAWIVNVRHKQGLKYACSEGHLEILKYLKSLDSETIPVKFDDMCLIAMNFDNLNKCLKSFEYILYETDYVFNDEVMLFITNDLDRKPLRDAIDNHKILLRKKELNESLNKDLIENNVPKKSQIKI